MKLPAPRPTNGVLRSSLAIECAKSAGRAGRIVQRHEPRLTSSSDRRPLKSKSLFYFGFHLNGECLHPIWGSFRFPRRPRLRSFRALSHNTLSKLHQLHAEACPEGG
jgi:hypothetical protein